LRVIISALQVVKACLFVIDIASVAERVVFAERGCKAAGGCGNLAPAVVAVGDNCGAAGVQNGDDITLQVGQVITGGIACAAIGAVLQRIGLAVCGVNEVQYGIITNALLQ